MAAQGTGEGSPIQWHPPHVVHLVSGAIMAVGRDWAQRQDIAWVGVVAAPLAMTATGMLDQWWSWPVLLIESAIATRSWRWSWVLALELSLVGTAWAFVGAIALGTWPSLLLPIGVLWGAFPAALAVTVAHERQQPILGAFTRPTSHWRRTLGG